MNEHILVLLDCLAVIIVLAVLLYAANRGQISALNDVSEIRNTLDQINDDTRSIQRSLRDHRRVLYDAPNRSPP